MRSLFQNTTARLRMAYIVAILSIAAVTVAAQLLLTNHSERLSNDAAVVNIAGRQRMLSQRIAKLSLLLEDARRESSDRELSLTSKQLRQTLKLFLESHGLLKDRSMESGLGGTNSQEVMELFKRIEPHYSSLVKHSADLIKALEYTDSNLQISADSAVHVDNIVEASDTFLPLMNDLVYLYEFESAHKVRSLQDAELWMAGLVLVILVLQVPIVFEPAVRIAKAGMQELNRANQTMTSFLANMSHEIRTPLTAIIGFTELLEHDEDVKNDEQTSKESLQAVHRNAEHLLTIINDILDISKIDAGMISLESLPVDPCRIVTEVVELLSSRARDKKIQLLHQCKLDLPRQFLSDPTRLRQILLNLVGNAIKFTEEGSVSIRASYDQTEELISFSVSDTGIGMSPEKLAKIAKFEPFNQADSSTTRTYGGSGLGLCISKALAEMLGGGISLESEQGSGSTFTATVSASELCGESESAGQQPYEANGLASSASGKQLPVQGSLPLEGVQVLLAEDGLDNQRLIKHFLKKAGAEVCVAENGQLACEYVREQHLQGNGFDIVVMDMQMPVMDGYTATRTLRDEGFGLPIIAATASALKSECQTCLDAGCDAYVTKPIDRTVFISTLQKYSAKDLVEATV